MPPYLIRRWRPEDVERVFGITEQRKQTCELLGKPLANPEVFRPWTWSGYAGNAARNAGKGHRKDIDAHGNVVAEVGVLAKKAVNQIRDIRRRLDNLERAITGSGMVLDDGNGMVSDPKGVSLAEELGSTGAALDAAARRALKERYQHEVNILMQDANQADRNLAIAIEGATGQIPLDQVRPSSPDSRPVSGLPGMPAAQVDEAAKKKSSMYDPLGTVRYVPMKLPKGWHDDPSNPRTDLGRHYARGVRFGPYDRGVTGPWSDTLNPKDAPKGRPDKVTIPFPKQEKEIDIKVYQSTRLRADGATPTSMREVTINGKQYLKIEYQYDYSASRSTAATINEIPLSPHPEWHKVSTEQVRVLQDRYGVQAPRPGA